MIRLGLIETYFFFVQFVIDKKGNIEKVSIHRGIPDTLDAEAKQVIKKMPNWIPGIKDGKPVSTYFLLPIQFKLG